MKPLRLSQTEGNSMMGLFKSNMNRDAIWKKYGVTVQSMNAIDTAQKTAIQESVTIRGVMSGIPNHKATDNMMVPVPQLLEFCRIVNPNDREKIVNTWISQATRPSSGLSHLRKAFDNRFLAARSAGFQNYGHMKSSVALAEEPERVGEVLRRIRDTVGRSIVELIAQDLKKSAVHEVTFAEALTYIYGRGDEATQYSSNYSVLSDSATLQSAVEGVAEGVKKTFNIDVTDVTPPKQGERSPIRALHLTNLPGSARKEGFYYPKLSPSPVMKDFLMKVVLRRSSAAPEIFASPLDDHQGHVRASFTQLFDAVPPNDRVHFPPRATWETSRAPTALSPNLFHETAHALQYLTRPDEMWTYASILGPVSAVDVAETPAVMCELLSTLPGYLPNNSLPSNSKYLRAERLVVLFRALIQAELDFRFNSTWSPQGASNELLMRETANAFATCLPGIQDIPASLNPCFFPGGTGIGHPYSGAMQAYLFGAARAAPLIVNLHKGASDAPAEAVRRALLLSPFGSSSAVMHAANMSGPDATVATPLSQHINKSSNMPVSTFGQKQASGKAAKPAATVVQKGGKTGKGAAYDPSLVALDQLIKL